MPPSRRRPAPTRSTHRPKRRARAARPAIVAGSLPADAIVPRPYAEPPHAHAVCRSCGRIADVPMSTEERGFLAALSDGRPERWDVHGITLSLTGFCPRCRSGRTL